MIMKIYNTLSALCLVFILPGCSDKLDITPGSNISNNAFYQTADDIEQAVVAAYDALQDQGQYGFNYMMFMEIRSDNAFVESPTNVSGEYGEIDLFNLSPGNSQLELTWNSCYRGIQRCNIVLDRIEGIDMDASAKMTRIGEVKFLRALTYFNLVRLWGDVPLVTTEIADPFETFSIGRTSGREVYAQIIRDLSDAALSLPSTNEEGRATSNAANALLGKVHLTLGNWSAAIAALRNVSGVLLDDYPGLFGIANENNAESIFEVQFQAGNGEGSTYPNQVAPVGSGDELLGGVGVQRGENIPGDDLFNSFETGDLRRDVSIGVVFETTNYAAKLIDQPVNDNDSDLNVIVLRYADVILMLAEALNEQSYAADGEAFDLINQIRNRAGLANVTSADLPDQGGFRDAVLEERRHEFVSENHRWFDLIRTGRAIDVMNASSPTVSVADHQLILPLPLSAIDAINDPATFPQNPGY